MEEYYRRIQALSPRKRQILAKRFSDWCASQANAENSLALFYVPRGQLSPQEVKAFLQQQVPDHMLPAEYIKVDQLPKTINGKVDRRALQGLRGQANQGETRDVALLCTETEKKVAKIWRQVLDLPEVNPDDNFFELGGHSLLGTQVIMEIEQVFGIQVPLSAIFTHRTLAKISRHLDQAVGSPSAEERLVQALPDELEESIPLSNAQRRLWYISQLSDRGLEYKIVKVLDMEGRLNVAALSQAVAEIVHRHETLRTCFGYVSGKLVQKILPGNTVPIDHVDLSSSSEAALEGAYEQIEAEILQRPFDLEQGPLMRMTLVKYSDSHARLVFDAHHIVIDGWSVGILVQELNSLFQSFSRGLPSGLAPLATQYRHYAIGERERLGREALDRQLAYWRGKLKGMPRLEFKRSRVGTAVATQDGEIDFDLGLDLQSQISAISARMQITPFMFLISLYQVLLSIHTGLQDIGIGTDVANRDSREDAKLIGFFVNQLVLRIIGGEDLTFSQLCQRTRQCVEEAFANKDLPYDALVRELKRKSAQRARHSLFRAKFVFHHSIPDIAIEEIRTRFIEVNPESGKFDLLLNLEEGRNGLSGKFEYSGAVFDEAAVARMIDQFKGLCELVAENVDIPLKKLADHVTAEDHEMSQAHLEKAKAGRQKDLREFLRSRTS